MLDLVLEKAKKLAQEAEVFWVRRKDTPLGFEANRLRHLEEKASASLTLRVIKDGRIGLSATTNIEDLDGLVSRAVEMAQWGPLASFHMPAFKSFAPVEVYDEGVEALSIDAMAELGQSMIDLVRQHNQELLCDAQVAKSLGEVEILNSSGGHSRYQKSVFRVSLEGTLVRGTDMLFVGDELSSCQVKTDTRAITDSVIRQVELGKDIVPAPVGKMPVVFTYEGVASALLGPLLTAFNGKAILQQASPLVGKLGEKLFDRCLSIWDDPTIPYVPGSRLCDDEGVPSQRAPLIIEGMVANFLYDLQTAGQAGAKSTASADRRMGSQPAPAPSTVVVQEGSTPLEQIIAGIPEGLLVEMLLGVGQGNILSGDFSGNVLLGYKIESGKLIGRVKDTMVAGNVYDALKEGVTISQEARWIMGSVRAPAMCCQNISVSGKD